MFQSAGNSSQRRPHKAEVSLLLIIALCLITILCLFVGLYVSYQQALLQSISTLNLDFVSRVNSTAASAENVLQNFAAQMYYMRSVSKMRTYRELSNSDMIEAIRILNDFTASSTILDSIYVYNGKQDYIYSTMSTGAVSDRADAFKDQEAVRLIRERSEAQLMPPLPRTSTISSSTTNREMVSLMFFSINSDGQPADNAMMFNINYDWFTGLYFGEEPNENAFILDRNTLQVVLSSDRADSALSSQLIAYMTSGISLDDSSNFIFTPEGSQTMLCFYAQMPRSGWIYVRAVPYDKYLSSLSTMQSNVYLYLSAACLVAMFVAIFFLVRIVFPFRSIRRSLSSLAPNAADTDDPVAQLNELIRQSSDSTHINQALRAMLRDEKLRGLVMGYDLPEDSLRADEFTLIPDRPITPLLVSSVRVEQMLDAVRPLCPHSEGVTIHSEHTVLLIQPDDADILPQILNRTLGRFTNRRIIVGLPVDNWHELPAAYAQLLECHQLRFLYPSSPVRILQVVQTLEDFSVGCEPMIDRILEMLKAGNREGVTLEYEQFLSSLPGKTYKSVIFALTQLARSVLKLYGEHFPEAVPTYRTARAQFDALLTSMDDIAELSPFFTERFSGICEQIRRDRHSRQSQLIDEVLQLIHDKFLDPLLNSQYLADAVGMSPAYLCRVFRQTQGISISDYINRTRIEEAKRLLIETDIKVMELGEQLGVENMQYFFVLFKQATGVTPRQYRMQHKNP